MTDDFHETLFQNKLIDSARWDDLAQAIIHYPSHVAPVERVRLFVRNAGENWFSDAAHWPIDGPSPNDECPDQFTANCDHCLAATSSLDMVLSRCPGASSSKEMSPLNRYCAPLVHHNQVAAVLQIDMPAGSELSGQQIKALNRVLPEMTLAIANAQLQHSLIIQAQEAESDRRRVAQDLHDSLAHTIGYLRLKLDYFSREGVRRDRVDTQAEIERMRDAASEAYEQIRCTLAELEPVCSNDLAATLLEQASVIGQREGFEVQMACSGEPIPVASEVQRQVLYICREALNNSSRHAHAHCVEIHLGWERDHFNITISDDGIGFNPDNVPLGDHFGLAIIEQRTQSIGGTVTIRSSPGDGTQLSLCSPAAYTRGSAC